MNKKTAAAPTRRRSSSAQSMLSTAIMPLFVADGK
jgi:hypothetical protein